MYHYLLCHEEQMKKLLEGDEKCDWVHIREYHKAQIEFMQHERLIHLIVTLFFSVLFIGSIVCSLLISNILFYILDFIFLIFEGFYIVHYYRLENGVQRWYSIFNEIDKRAKKNNK